MNLKERTYLWYIALLRIYVGYYMLQQGIRKFQRDFPRGDWVGRQIGDLTTIDLYPWYKKFLVDYVVPHQELFGNNLFCGDTLFTAGCGRLFEGTPEQMHGSLKKLMGLPDDTKVYCGHEYTESNLRFAMTLEPKNHKLVSRFERVQGLRARGASTVPSTMEEEKQTNPFLRWDSKEIQAKLKAGSSGLRLDPFSVFATVRKLKDAF